MSIGDRIKAERTKKNITQLQLAELLGSSQSLIAAYENGRKTPKLRTIKLIAQALDINPLSLLPPEMVNVQFELTLSNDDKTIVEAVQGLNQAGKKKVQEYAEDLSKIPKYRADK